MEGGRDGGRGGCGTLGLDAVRHSNNGGTDHPAEGCFYCKESLHECIQARSLNVTKYFRCVLGAGRCICAPESIYLCICLPFMEHHIFRIPPCFMS